MEFNINVQLDDNISLEIGREVLKKSMNAMRNEAILKAPVDTGELRSKIQLEVISKDEINLWSLAPYSIFMEYGTINKIKFTPYMRPALDITQNILLPQIILATKAKYR